MDKITDKNVHYINKRGVAGKKQNQSAETWPGWESKAVVGTYTVVKLCT